MGTYATIADVSDRLSDVCSDGFVDGAPPTGTRPTATRVNAWIDEAENVLNNCLSAIGITAPITNAAGKDQLGIIVADYAEGRTRQLNAAAGGDGTNDDGKDLIDRLQETCDAILKNPQLWGEMLSQGSGSVRRLFGHPTDDVDNRPTSSFAPEFTKGQDW